MNRYKHIIKFYRESKDKAKVKAAMKEILITKKYLDQMNFLRKIDLDKYNENEVMLEVINKLK